MSPCICIFWCLTVKTLASLHGNVFHGETSVVQLLLYHRPLNGEQDYVCDNETSGSVTEHQ